MPLRALCYAELWGLRNVVAKYVSNCQIAALLQKRKEPPEQFRKLLTMCVISAIMKLLHKQ